MAATRRKHSTNSGRTAPAKTKTRRSSDEAAKALQHFRELFRLSQRHFQRIEERVGLSGAQLWALSAICLTPGMRVSELAETLTIHLSTTSNLLDKLEERGLVRRERSSDDQRTVRIRATATGVSLQRRAPGPAAGIIPDALAKMPPKDVAQLRRSLEQVLHFAQARDQRAAMKHLAEP